MKFLSKFVSTLFYSGLSPIAPGTCGSILALLLIFPTVFAQQSTQIFYVFAFLLISTVAGFALIPQYLSGKTDDMQEIVIDEAAGLYLTIFLAMITLRMLKIEVNTIVLFGASFVFFRIFDITKPLIIGYFDRTLKGAVGIMVDDLLAGVFAALCIVIMFAILHKI